MMNLNILLYPHMTMIYMLWNNIVGSISIQDEARLIPVNSEHICNGPLTRYVKMWVAHDLGMPGTFFFRHRLQWKPLGSDPGMRYGTCVEHVPWCISGSLNRGCEENVPGIPGACITHNFMHLARGPWNLVDFYFVINTGCCNEMSNKQNCY